MKRVYSFVDTTHMILFWNLALCLVHYWQAWLCLGSAFENDSQVLYTWIIAMLRLCVIVLYLLVRAVEAVAPSGL